MQFISWRRLWQTPQSIVTGRIARWTTCRRFGFQRVEIDSILPRLPTHCTMCGHTVKAIERRMAQSHCSRFPVSLHQGYLLPANQIEFLACQRVLHGCHSTAGQNQPNYAIEHLPPTWNSTLFLIRLVSLPRPPPPRRAAGESCTNFQSPARHCWRRPGCSAAAQPDRAAAARGPAAPPPAPAACKTKATLVQASAKASMNPKALSPKESCLSSLVE